MCNRVDALHYQRSSGVAWGRQGDGGVHRHSLGPYWCLARSVAATELKNQTRSATAIGIREAQAGR